MKKTCAVLSLILLLLFSGNGYSQDVKKRFGLYGGLGFSTITGLDAVDRLGLPNVDYSIKNFSSGYKFMWDIGVSYQYEKFNTYFLQTNVILFNTTGAKIKGVSKKYDSDIDAINTSGLLFHFFCGKKIIAKNDFKFIVGIGPCVFVNYAPGYGGSADVVYYDKEYYDDYTDEYYYGEESSVVGGESPDVNLFGLGANAIAGIESGKSQISIVGDYGFTKVFKDSRYSSYHRSVKLSYIYFF